MKIWTLGTMCVALGLIANMPTALRAQNASGIPAKDIQPLVDKALVFLKSSQGADGSFSPKIAGPGVSALVAAALLKNGVSPKEPVLAKTLAYLETQVQKDGGVYGKGLANYTTSVAIMSFSEANREGKYDSILKNAANFLKGIQHNDPENNPSHGGFSYDGKKKPDTSNSGFSIEALVAAGIPKDDPSLVKAMKFISRAQNLPGEFNDQPFAKKVADDDLGGFTYNPLAGDDNKNKTPTGGLRSLGAMTYSGLKSFLYAGVGKDDPRVKAAVSWMRRHYSLDENPGMGKAGLFYYYSTFAKAMQAWGEDEFADGKNVKHNWRAELFTALKTRQLSDGSWQNTGDRTFAEENKDLATAFALISLSYAKSAK